MKENLFKAEKSIINKTKNKLEILRTIAENMLKTRPKDDVVYRPYTNHKGIRRQILGSMKIDLNEFFLDAKEGDIACVAVSLLAPHRETICLSVDGNVRVFFKGKEMSFVQGKDKLEMTVESGENELFFECECKNSNFSFSFVPSLTHYPGMWACDYLFWIRAVSPVEGYKGEDGIKVYNENACVFPIAHEDDNKIDFSSIFSNGENVCAYALSYCKNDGEIIITNNSKVYVNGVLTSGAVALKMGDRILLKCLPNDEKWGFSVKGNEILHIPFLKSCRKNTHWLLLGEFDKETDIKIQFTEPYINKRGEKTFWRFADKSTFLRPYLDTSFFGQWFYALMVGEYGLLKASEFLGEEYKEYFQSSMQIMADYFEYMRYDAQMFGSPTFLQRSINLADLDSIGTIGMNFAEAYNHNKSEKLMCVLKQLAKATKENIPRFSDGTYHRETTMWADDTFMSCPFLVRMGKLTGDNTYFDECINQLLGYKKRLYMEDEKIFSHIYFLEDEKPNRVPWGRGNGWVFITLSEVLEHLPEDYPNRGRLIELFKEFTEGLCNQQDESGMWHQVLNMPSSYLETSCTAMFVLGMARGIIHGWIDNKYYDTIIKAWNGLAKTAIDIEGNIYGVCKGSWCSYDASYYAKLGTVKNDDHGTGIVLAAICELLKLEN